MIQKTERVAAATLSFCATLPQLFGMAECRRVFDMRSNRKVDMPTPDPSR